MIEIVSGVSGSGKTTYLCKLIEEDSLGFITPALFEGKKKTAISYRLLPQADLYLFACEAGDSEKDQCTGLHWQIDPAAICQINDYMDMLEGRADLAGRKVFVDELGPLELRNGQGLQSALAFCKKHAADADLQLEVVIRPSLVDSFIAYLGLSDKSDNISYVNL
ncbi:MAG: hypothetical protein LBL67_02645 [Coriobacteriales bacterium]|nr:hypothetical protein [Coriobacteriales bacterium]